MRLRRLSVAENILVVEGSTDKSALMKWLSPTVHVVAGAGKEQVVLARSFLEPRERDRCTILIDCDGVVLPEWLADGDVVVTEMRDLEADLISKFPLVDNLVSEFAWEFYQSGQELTELSRTLGAFAYRVATDFGILKQAASELGLTVGTYDEDLGRRRRLRLSDLAEGRLTESWPSAPSVGKLLGMLGMRQGWNESQLMDLEAREAVRRTKRCRAHRRTSCGPCASRSFANGHDLVDALYMGLKSMGAAELDVKSVERSVRISASVPVDEWHVLKRLEMRSVMIGRPILRI